MKLMLAVVLILLVEISISDSVPAYCKLPKAVGPCKARYVRYYYNSKYQKCQQFIYGGCQGNGNNFHTKDQCRLKCEGSVPTASPTIPKICTLPRVVGPCYGIHPRYFYNKISGTCERFSYGGCRGNKNNFESMKECLKICLV